MKILRFVIFLLLSNIAQAQEGIDAGALNSVVQEIVTGSGPVTKQEYDKFWAQFGANTTEDRSRLIGLMKQRFMLTQEYQREVWICAEQAWNLRSVPRCEKAQNKLNLLKNEMKDNQAAVSPLEDYSTKLLKAAASHGSIQNPNGNGDVPVSLEMIKTTRSGLDKMLSRLSQVMRPNY
jgi:hypothetical protein